MDAAQARRRGGTTQDKQGHASALVVAATRLLRSGEARRAFELADRRCRLDEPPGAADRAVRALAGRLCGWPFWREDLAAARRADPLDPVVNSTVLRLGSAEEQREAARHLVAATHVPPHALQDALGHLFGTGERTVVRLDLVDNRLSGWVAWQGFEDPFLDIEGPGRTVSLRLEPETDLGFLPASTRGALVEAVLPFHQARAVCVRTDRAVMATGPLHARSRRGTGQAKGEAPRHVPQRARLVVVVPVYDDLDATTSCLDAAIAEVAGEAHVRLVVVDDASPNAALRTLLDERAAEGLIELRRNGHNLGFSGAVRSGMEEAGGADVLLLNADTRLPAGALRRLCDAAYSAPDIGTVTPFSNNGEYASFPSAGLAHPLPSPQEAAAIDAAAATANAGVLVDLPTGTGFCLYLRHDCRAAVGEMPGLYGRGYFEDMEFCLRAGERGFRNVCAASVFVPHHGSRSFGADKAALVSRNLRLLRTRHPQTRADCAAHVAADPLRRARAAIEAVLAPPPSGRLLVAQDGNELAALRLAELGDSVSQLVWSQAGGGTTVRLVGPNGAAPQSLRYDMGTETRELSTRLRAMAPETIELIGRPRPPSSVVELLLSVDAAFAVSLGEAPGWPDGDTNLLSPLAIWRDQLGARLRQAIVCDSQSWAELAADPSIAAGLDLVDARAKSRADLVSPAPGAPISLGVVCHAPSPAVDGFVRDLACALRNELPAARIVVIGRSRDDLALTALGNVAVTGPVGPAEVPAILALFGVRALVLPPPSTCLAAFERLADRFDLPRALPDWTAGRLDPPHSSTLFLDPFCRDARTAFSIADWFAHRIEAAPA